MNLRKFSIFTSLPEEQIEKISAAATIRTIEKNQFACHKGEPSDGLYLIVSGRLQAIEITEDGRKIGLNYIEPGSFLGELSVVDGLPRSADIVAIERSEIACIPQSTAQNIFYNTPSMAEAMLRHLAGMVRNTNQQRVILSIPNTNQRVYTHLLSLTTELPGGLMVIDNLPKQQHMAIMLNTTRETISRAIRELEQRGIVEKDMRRLIVRKPKELHQLVHLGK